MFAIVRLGMDLLPREVTAQFEGSLVRQLDAVELVRAFRVAVHGLLREIQNIDVQLAERLHGGLISLTEIEIQDQAFRKG